MQSPHNISDISREWINLSKIFFAAQVFLNKKYTKNLLSVDDFSSIDFKKLTSIWKKWMILDVDDCIAPHHGEIITENKNIIFKLLWKGWKIVIFSNMKKSQRYEELESKWIEVITSPYPKPSKKWFEACLENLWLKAGEVVMIWDNFLTDGGSRNAGIDFIKVSPIEKDDIKSFSRICHKFTRRIADVIAYRRKDI